MGPIIVPLDESTYAEQALPWAAMVARAQDRPVHLVTVRPSPEAYWEFADLGPDASIDAHQETVDDYLEHMRVADELKNVAVTLEVLDGDIVQQLTWLCERVRAELMVLTTRGRGGFGMGGVGSVADRLVRRLQMPVMVVPPDVQYVPVEAIMVPLDGSDESTRALSPARSLSQALPAALHLVHAVNPDAAWGLPDEHASQYLSAMESRARAHLESLAEPGDVVSVVQGAVPGALLDYAGEHGCRLVVMTTHGRVTEPMPELGGIAAAMMRSIDRPVYFVRVPER